MRNSIAIVLTTIIAIVSTSTKLWAEEPKVVEAQIYPDQAIMVIPMPEGQSANLDLPGTIDLDSIKLEHQEETVLMGTSLEQFPRSNWTPPSLAPVVKERDQVRKALAERQGTIQSLEQNLNLLDELRPEISPSDLVSYSDNFMKTRSNVVKRLVEEKEAMEKLALELKDLQNLVDDRMPEDDETMTRVWSSSSGKGPISVRCSTVHAGWHPSYRMDLNMEKSILTAQLNGTVWQKTGLPFSGKISLHMGRPSRFSDPIKLNPLTISLVDPSDNKPSYRGETRLATAPMLMEMDMMMTKAMDVAVEETLTDRSFSFEGDIRGDGVSSTILLEKWTEEIKPTMVTVPSLSPTLWLIAEGTISDSRTVKTLGEMYVDGSFSGKGMIPRLVRGQTFSIPFGEIPGVQIKREDKIAQSGSTWIGKGTLRRGYVITTTNGLQKRVSIIVKDRIPVTTNDKVSVSVTTLSPSPSETDQETGIVSWSLDLEPGETKEIHVIYDLRYPSDKELIFSR